ncbi:fluoride efflux transporter CrcB [Rathayibacter sp. YIM 133350]|uniref:fluoride efflux transporter CrcB n=1 Tax=Rathayibacter sp. YIM 133350 TaxID=3131992 RepID=UPI00307CECF3
MSVLAVVGALLGGSFGAVARFLLAYRLPVRRGHLPWGVLVANVVGSGIGGGILALAGRAAVSADWKYVILSGLCGGLTTFSTWSVESIELLDGGRWRAAVLNVLVNLALGFAAAGGAYLLLR